MSTSHPPKTLKNIQSPAASPASRGSMDDRHLLPTPKVLRVSELQLHSGPIAERCAKGLEANFRTTPLSQSIGSAPIGALKGRAWDWAVFICTVAVAASVALGSMEFGLPKDSGSTPIVIEFESGASTDRL